MRASVVVPTYRRPDLLERCLRALVDQDFDPALYEVIVADDAASDETRRQVESYAGRPGPVVRYVPVTGTRGPAAARNAGWRAARGRFVGFTDDDCIPDHGWISAGLTAFEDGVAAVAGRVVVPLPEDPTDYDRDTAGLEGAEFVTANCFCRRETLSRLGGFDERFTAAWREDSDLHFRLLGEGRMVRAESAVVFHPVRPARWGVSVGQQRKSLFDALLYKKHPALYRQRIRPAPPWDYYAIVAGVLAMAVGFLVRNAGLLTVASLTWLLPTARFCARRLRGTSRTPGHVAEILVTSVLIPPVAVFWRLYGALKYRVLFL
jgi:glycosyltransferase involved in cell wall biosynthesis